ncbi:MAG: beta strand repeat-containing protein, partial [Isosphaeraceae bacterium]
LTLISRNSISQSGAGNLTISGMANFVAGGSGASGDLTLNNATNNFGTVTATGANITIADASALTITDIVVKDSQNQNGNGTVSITAQNLTLTGNLIAGLAGVVNLLPTAGLIVDLGVKSTGNFGLLASEINRITAGTLVIGSNTAGAILNTVPINRSNATLGRNLTLISGSTITQTDGNLTVAWMANFVSNGTGTSGNITLNNLTNNFYSTGCIASSGTNITIINSYPTVLARTVASGCLTVNSPSGAITQATGTSISVAGMANFVTGSGGTAGNITLNNATNNFTTITASGTNITIAGTNAITVNGIIGSNVNLTSGGNLTVNSTGISATGDVSLQSTLSSSLMTIGGSGIDNQSGPGTITLTGGYFEQSAGVIKSNSTIAILTLQTININGGTIQTPGNVTLNAANAISQTSGNIVSGGTANIVST